MPGRERHRAGEEHGIVMLFRHEPPYDRGSEGVDAEARAGGRVNRVEREVIGRTEVAFGEDEEWVT